MRNRSAKILLAGLLGTIAGAVGGILLAPQSGRKTRAEITKMAGDLSRQLRLKSLESKKRIEEVFGEVSDDTKQKYQSVRNKLMERLANIQRAGDKIDKDKYFDIVDEIVSEFKGDLKNTKNGAKRITKQLQSDWIKVKKAISA